MYTCDPFKYAKMKFSIIDFLNPHALVRTHTLYNNNNNNNNNNKTEKHLDVISFRLTKDTKFKSNSENPTMLNRLSKNFSIHCNSTQLEILDST